MSGPFGLIQSVRIRTDSESAKGAYCTPICLDRPISEAARRLTISHNETTATRMYYLYMVYGGTCIPNNTIQFAFLVALVFCTVWSVFKCGRVCIHSFFRVVAENVCCFF